MTDDTRGRVARIVDWTFRDRTTGAITIAQSPNLALWLFLALTALAWLVGSQTGSASPAAVWLRVAQHLALAWWALDEILRGVNPWRRFLGALALVWLVGELVATLAS